MSEVDLYSYYGAMFVRVDDFDAERALRLAAERQLGELRERLACKTCGGSKWVPEPFSIRENSLPCPNCSEIYALQTKLDKATGLLRKVDMHPSGCTADVPVGWWNKRAELLLECMPSRNTTSTEGKDHDL